jgi:hypothetical protein
MCVIDGRSLLHLPLVLIGIMILPAVAVFVIWIQVSVVISCRFRIMSHVKEVC